MNKENKEALLDAEDVLCEEANVLASLNGDKAFAAMDHRVEIAVSREIERLRGIASKLEEMRQEKTP